MTLLDSATSPSIAPVDAGERSHRLSAAGEAWGSRIAAKTSAAQLTYSIGSTSAGSVATVVTSGRHSFIVDEPAALAGDDLGASPVEYALGALTSCQVVIYRLYAEVLGIRVDDIQITAEGDLDARTMFGIDGGPRAGFTGVRLDIRISGPETDERYQELKDVVDAHCPVLDLFTNATPVSAKVTKA